MLDKNVAIIDLFFGDNGKGKIVHDFSPNYDYCIRTSGANNCGHVVYRDGKKYVHRLLPSADYRYKNVKSFLAQGVMINLHDLIEEIKKAEEDFPGVGQRIFIDPDAFLIFEKHIEEDKLKNGHIGSTNKGVGPAVVDKFSRSSKRVIDAIKENYKEIDDLKKLGVQFKHVMELQDDFQKSRLIFEGAQGILLDPNFGTYPYCTCTSTDISSIYFSGFNFTKLDKVFGLTKCYATRVGAGPFTTEIFNEEAENLRNLGSEVGSVTGRKRRVGWLDLPAIQYSCKRSAITDIIVTKLDILNSMDKIPVCYKYNKTPVCGNDFFDAVPYYIDFKGWNDAKDDLLNYENKNSYTKQYIKYIEMYTGIKVSHASCGTSKEDLISL